MLVSALLIHLTGGRIETHFHVFGSLAFLAFYRDWRVLISASSTVALDHYLRGVYWPASVYGVLAPSWWRWLEHAGWVIFEDFFLITACLQGMREMKEIARRQASVEALHENVEQQVLSRTAALKASEEGYEQAPRARPGLLVQGLCLALVLLPLDLIHVSAPGREERARRGNIRRRLSPLYLHAPT